MEIPKFNVSFKRQNVGIVSEHTVRRFFLSNIRDSYKDPQFVRDVMKPLLYKNFIDKKLPNLCLEEFQRVSLIVCLGKVRSLVNILCDLCYSAYHLHLICFVVGCSQLIYI